MSFHLSHAAGGSLIMLMLMMMVVMPAWRGHDDVHSARDLVLGTA